MLSPTFSFLLITYKQEQFVKDAFLSCINQTEGDYEIVISDDHSPDNTFSVLKQLVENYRKEGGTIPITLHQNDTNLGIGGNFQKAAELSRGKWLLMAAGDDISLSTRIATIRSIVERHSNIYGINTARFFVDEKGCGCRYIFQPGYLLGADSVWDRQLFTEFPPLDSHVMSEDHILNLRAWLMGGMLQVNTPTIKYRISSQNYSIHKSINILDAKRQELKKTTDHIALLYFRLEDIAYWEIKGHTDSLYSEVRKRIYDKLEELNRQQESYCLFLEVAENTFAEKLRYLFSSHREWLHTNFFFRLYNLLKMTGIVTEIPLRKVDEQKVETKQDDREILISLKDYVIQQRFILF